MKGASVDPASARHARRRAPGRRAGEGRLRLRRPGAADPQAAAHRHAGGPGAARHSTRRNVDALARSTARRESCKDPSHELVEGRQGGPRGYHHGNLKEALVRAALELIAEKGPAGFTFAEAARWAGVSPAAPYRHFRDRDELLADVARRGFEQFEAALARAWDDGRPDAVRGVRAARQGLSGIRPQRAGLLLGHVRGGHSARHQPGAARRRATGRSRCCAPRPNSSSPRCRRQSRPPALMMALHIWALSHGIASLFGRGDAGRGARCRCRRRNCWRPAVLIYLRGLGFREPSGTPAPP